MALVSPLSCLQAAQREGWAVPALNIHTLETLHAAVNAAAALRSPLILQTSGGTLKHMGLPYVAACCRAAAEEASVPLALHMDHCSDFDLLVRCLRAGYTSLMVDGSALPYGQNVALTRRVVEIAHAAGVMVEAELGRVGGVEDDLSVDDQAASLTDPAQAADFAEQTGVDTLAVSIGTAHGMYRGEPKLDFDRLASIRARVSVPLVLHGGSGIPEEAIRRAISLGIAKVNVATEMKLPMAEAIRRAFAENPELDDPRVYMGRARQAMEKMALDKITMCGAAGKAAGL